MLPSNLTFLRALEHWKQHRGELRTRLIANLGQLTYTDILITVQLKIEDGYDCDI